MNGEGRTPRKSLDDTLREAMHGAPDGFDYEALVAGTHERAGRIRRRRAVGTLAAAAVLVPGLIGGGVLVSTMIEDQAVQPLPAGPSEGAADGDAGDDPATGDASTATDDAAPTTQAPTTPPWQDGELPVPEGAEEESDADSDNAWEIPDPRPTGVAFLDDLGAPQDMSAYRRTSPVMGSMTCDRADIAEDAMEPLGTAEWTYYPDDADYPAVTITVSGWEDGVGAMDGLRADELFCAWDLDDNDESVQAETSWPGRPGEEDYYLNEAYPGFGYMSDTSVSVSVVRTGDYLVAVRVQDADPVVAEDASTEIAEKTAENLAALDPEHGGTQR